MRQAICELKSVSPYSQCKYHQTEKLEGELPVDYEKRTWREKCNTIDGNVFIPPMAFANSLKEAAALLGIQVPGKGQNKFTKHFESGVMVFGGLKLPILKSEVQGEWLFVPSDGKRGGGKRVNKCFPLIHEWKGKVVYRIMDDMITEDVFEKVIKASGQSIGIGRFRPKNWGYYGRFEVKKIEWVNVK